MEIVQCEECGTMYEIESYDPDICLFPWPHIECQVCGCMIPLFLGKTD